MKPGAENRKKTIAAGGLGAAALLCCIYGYNQIFGGTTNPAATATPAPATTNTVANVPASTSTTTRATASSANASTAPTVVIPGAAARKIATSSAALDPTLDESSMLRTENLIYTGSGRNIFSATYTPLPAAVNIPKNVPPARPTQPVYVPPANQGPPPPPPINLKFFGTAQRGNGVRQAFLLQGDDVYLASPGDIVARKYKIVSIGQNSLQVTDLQNNNTQTLPLSQ